MPLNETPPQNFLRTALNKCVIYGCNSGCNKKHEQVHGFSFHFNKPDLSTIWIKLKKLWNARDCYRVAKSHQYDNGSQREYL